MKIVIMVLAVLTILAVVFDLFESFTAVQKCLVLLGCFTAVLYIESKGD